MSVPIRKTNTNVSYFLSSFLATFYFLSFVRLVVEGVREMVRNRCIKVDQREVFTSVIPDTHTKTLTRSW